MVDFERRRIEERVTVSRLDDELAYGRGGTSEATAWTEESSRRWLVWCDRCWRFYLTGLFYETYSTAGWWWECTRCNLLTVTRYAERRARESRDRTWDGVAV